MVAAGGEKRGRWERPRLKLAVEKWMFSSALQALWKLKAKISKSQNRAFHSRLICYQRSNTRASANPRMKLIKNLSRECLETCRDMSSCPVFVSAVSWRNVLNIATYWRHVVTCHHAMSFEDSQKTCPQRTFPTKSKIGVIYDTIPGVLST